MITNIKFNEIKKLIVNYKNVVNNINGYMVQGEDDTINGVYYYIVSDEEVSKVHDMVTGGRSKKS